MDDQKIREVLGIYRESFKENNVKPVEWKENLAEEDAMYLSEDHQKQKRLSHLCWMLDEIESFLKDGRRDKAFRWLGFIQGVLWNLEFCSLEDLKNHNRP
ncbi:MAG: hypothetical protein Q8R12_03275 [bacterium]|nr:hypothetical protein [bacterium]